MPIKPLRDFVLVKPLDASQVEGSTLYVPEDPTAKIQRGEVVVVGEDLDPKHDDLFIPVRVGSSVVVPFPDGTRAFYVDVCNLPPDEVEGYLNKVKERVTRARAPSLQPGDTVLYSVYGANELRDGGQKLFLVPAKELMGKVEK